MKYSKCPHCGSKNGYMLKNVKYIGYENWLIHNCGGITVIEGTFLQYSKHETKPLYCIDCGKRICTYNEMFKEELKCAKLK